MSSRIQYSSENAGFGRIVLSCKLANYKNIQKFISFYFQNWPKYDSRMDVQEKMKNKKNINLKVFPSEAEFKEFVPRLKFKLKLRNTT